MGRAADKESLNDLPMAFFNVEGRVNSPFHRLARKFNNGFPFIFSRFIGTIFNIMRRCHTRISALEGVVEEEGDGIKKRTSSEERDDHGGLLVRRLQQVALNC